MSFTIVDGVAIDQVRGEREKAAIIREFDLIPMRSFPIDVMRAVAIFMMTINHAYPSVLNNFTLREFALSDAAEMLILASGASAGIALSKRLDAAGWVPLFRRLGRRLVILYLASIGTTIAFVLQSLLVVSSGMSVSTSAVKSDLPTIEEVLLLTHSQGNVLILRTYLFLSLLIPPILYLARKNMVWTLLLSFGLYAVMQVRFWLYQEGLGAGQLWFWISSWQFLFVIAFCFGMRGGVSISAWLVVVSLLVLQFGLLVQLKILTINFGAFCDKPSLGPLRLLSGLAVGILAWRFLPSTFPRVGARWRSVLESIIAPGRCPLFAFIVSELVVVFADLFARLLGYSLFAQIIFPLGAVGIVMISSILFLRYTERDADIARLQYSASGKSSQ